MRPRYNKRNACYINSRCSKEPTCLAEPDTTRYRVSCTIEGHTLVKKYCAITQIHQGLPPHLGARCCHIAVTGLTPSAIATYPRHQGRIIGSELTKYSPRPGYLPPRSVRGNITKYSTPPRRVLRFSLVIHHMQQHHQVLNP